MGGEAGEESLALSLQALPRGEAPFTLLLTEPLTLQKTIPRGESKGLLEGVLEREGGLLSDPVIELPLPESWVEESVQRRPAPLVGTGLGLFGLREAPFVGRERERDQIWEALRRVVEERRLQVVLISGEAGVGKSRLAQWVCARAHEVGAVEVLPALFQSRGQGSAGGLAGMIQGFFQSWMLSRAELYEHLLQRLPPLDQEDPFRDVDARGLTELIHPLEGHGEGSGPNYFFASSEQRDALVGRFLSRIARRRRALVYLDDIQFSETAPRLISHLLDEEEDAPPVLVVATLRSDLLREDPGLQAQVEKIREHPSTTAIELSPIDREEHRRWIEETLPLAAELAETLARRTEGNPLFAHQLLGHWIASESLVLTERGFEVHQEASASMPLELHGLWMSRIDGLLEGYPEEERSLAEEGLLIAAVLGKEVHSLEWSHLCGPESRGWRERLVDDLVARALAVRSSEGFRFTHGLLVESLCERAGQEGCLQAYHLRCAEMLAEIYPHNRGVRGRREGEHLVAAGEFERALEPIWMALEYMEKRGFQTRWRETGLLHRRCIEACGPGETKNRHMVLYHLHRGKRLYLDGEFSEAVETIAEGVELARRTGAQEEELRVRLYHARLMLGIGEGVTALRKDMEQSQQLARELGNLRLEAEAYDVEGMLAFDSGLHGEAEVSLTKALGLFRACGAEYDALWSEAYLGWIRLGRGGYQEAMKSFQEVLSRAEERGYRSVSSHCLNGMADGYRYLRQWEKSEALYAQVRQIDREMGSGQGEIAARLTQVILAVGRGDDLEASRLLESACFRDFEWSRYRSLVDCMNLVLMARRGDQKGLWGWLEEKGEWDAELLWRDQPWLIDLAIEALETQGSGEIQEALKELSASLWRRIGDEEEAEKYKSV